MAVIRTSKKDDATGSLATLINDQTWEISYLDINNGNKIFNRGGGFATHPDHAGHTGYDQGYSGGGTHRGMGYPGSVGFGTNFGAWTLIPNKNFSANVRMWGGGGGSHNHGANDPRPAGGGGYAEATVQFHKDIPYVIWVGQGGHRANHNHSADVVKRLYRISGTFGGGGGAPSNGGTGGGLSGIFYNTLSNDAGSGGGHSHGHSNSNEAGSVTSIFRNPSQANAILIAGGGGGSGHASTNHHGQGGGGGGTVGQSVHNSGGGSQTAGGYGSSYGSGQAGQRLAGGHGGSNSHGAGGGGGWWGGGGGGHSGSHHNGASGGSGHSLEITQAGFLNEYLYNRYPDLVTNSNLIGSDSNHGNYHNIPGGMDKEDWGGAGVGGGYGSDGGTFQLNMGSFDSHRTQGTNGRVVIEVI